MTKKIRSIDFPGLSEFNRASEGPQNGGKMTGMDLLEFRDINGPDPMPKYGAIWSIGCLVWISPPPRYLEGYVITDSLSQLGLTHICMMLHNVFMAAAQSESIYVLHSTFLFTT